ncbi:MAG: class I SAM-dependent methyltransferase [Coriobacteriia bacterium]
MEKIGFIKPRHLKKASVITPLQLEKLVSGDVVAVEQAYSEVFEHEPSYDTLDAANLPKLTYLLEYARSISGNIIDAGCGRGNVLRHLNQNGCPTFGVEISKICFEQYLQNLPAANVDIVSWSKTGHTYDGCICTDVLEHIPLDQLDPTLEALRRLSPSLFAGIANTSSVHSGYELHVIREGISWWVQHLAPHYSRLSIIVPRQEDEVLWRHFHNEAFFFIRCEA